jgi:hypothetical protein
MALEQAALLKVPPRSPVTRCATHIATPRPAPVGRRVRPPSGGAFAVAWEWENTALTAELIEYHSARGSFSTENTAEEVPVWAGAQAVLVDTEPEPELAEVAAGPEIGAPSLTRLGPLPPLRMDPGAEPILAQYRALARQRYGREVTTDEPAWPTWI